MLQTTDNNVLVININILKIINQQVPTLTFGVELTVVEYQLAYEPK